jgi:hypothetical protein
MIFIPLSIEKCIQLVPIISRTDAAIWSRTNFGPLTPITLEVVTLPHVYTILSTSAIFQMCSGSRFL